jgi:translation initiation factor 4G
MKNNESNVILLWQGFASSVPWGIIFIFLNDYLSQERGFSVPDATYLVAVFGAGCAIGGILGGYWGQLLMLKDRSYLPWFMSATTFLGIIPFLILLNVHFPNAHGWGAVLCALSGGLIASLPSVNVRPCLINVNPPETRGAALTAANLIINVARGAGPSCITLMGAVFQFNRQFSFNVTVRFSTVLCCTI